MPAIDIVPQSTPATGLEGVPTKKGVSARVAIAAGYHTAAADPCGPKPHVANGEGLRLRRSEIGVGICR